MFVEYVDWESDLGEESLNRFDTCLEYWTFLVPKAAKMFMEGIGRTSLSGLRVVSSWGYVRRCCTSEDLDVEQMGSMLRALYAMHGMDFLKALLFQFPGF